MCSKWIENVKSAIPRGFSRWYVVEILREGPHTGKEIINRAREDSDDIWSPSPGLIYPLLGRLLEEGIITETIHDEKQTNNERNKKRYTLTKKGINTTKEIHNISRDIKNQIDVMCKLGDAGKFVATDIAERIASIAYMVNNDIIQDKARYRQFLTGELERLDKDENEQNHNDTIKYNKTIKDAKNEKINSKEKELYDQNSGQKIKVE